MQYKTYGELRLKVQRETDTEAEDFVTQDEFKDYFQEAVDVTAAHIYKVWPVASQYFEKLQKIDLTVNQQLIDLPEDIYARAITKLMFNGLGKSFIIPRLKGSMRHAQVAEISQFDNYGDNYQYEFINESPAVDTQIQLWPKSKDEGTGVLWLWYVRQPIQIVDDTSLIDIPEFYYFIIAYVKAKVLNKIGEATAQEAAMDRDKKLELLLQTLAEMTPDEDNKTEGDYSHYEEMS